MIQHFAKMNKLVKKDFVIYNLIIMDKINIMDYVKNNIME